MSNRAGNKVFRLGFIAVLGAAVIVIVANLKSPMSIGEAEVQTMIRKHELVGLSLDEAAEKLQHKAPSTIDGSVVFDFKHVKGWRAGSVCLDVKAGKVMAATWLPADGSVEDVGESDVR